MSRLLPDVLEDVRSDLAAFADPETQLVVTPTGVGVDVQWVRDGEELSATLRPGRARFPDVVIAGKRMSYRSFLASEYMADLRHLASSLKRTRIAPDFDPELYVDVRARQEAEDGKEYDAVSLIAQLSLEALPSTATRIVFVHAEAGAGKSWMLCRLAYTVAEAFERGDATTLFLYANAQGKSLAIFDEVVARALDDYRARFTYHAVAPLTRRGCIVVIFDGFDELLGSGGYGEAYSSLSNFVAQLDGQGSLVASARSAFYSYQDFHRAATRYAGTLLNYQLEPVEMLLWGDDQAGEYFRRVAPRYPSRFTDPDNLYDEVGQAVGADDRGLLRKPFFLAKIAELIGTGERLDPNRRLTSQLVEAFVEREVAKIVIRQREPLLSKDQHLELLTELAGEMWWQESGAVDVGSLQALGELLAEKWRLSDREKRIVEEKLPSYGLLTTKGARERWRLFEHEVYFAYFLARYAQQLLSADNRDAVKRFLARGPLPASVGEEIAAIQRWGADEIRHFVDVFARIGGVRTEILRANAGLVVAGLLNRRRDLPPNLVIEGVVIRERPIVDATIDDAELKNTEVINVDLRGTVLRRLRLSGSVLNGVRVDLNTTRFPETILRINEELVGLVVAGELLYEPTRIAAALRQMEAVVPGFEDAPEAAVSRSPQAERRAYLLKRFVRLAMRQFYIGRSDSRLRRVFADQEWMHVESAMRKQRLLSEKMITKSGAREPLMVLQADPWAILRGEDPAAPVDADIKALWEAIRD
jgi:hypothetical protein